MNQRDQVGLPDPGRDNDPGPPGVVTERTHGEAHQLDDGYGTVEFVETTSTYNPWDDLKWLLDTRDSVVFYSGPDYVRLREVVDEHIARIVNGHAGCGCRCGYSPVRGAAGVPEHP